MSRSHELAKQYPNRTLYFIEATQMYVTVEYMPFAAIKQVEYFTKDLKFIVRLSRSDIYFLMRREKWIEISIKAITMYKSNSGLGVISNCYLFKLSILSFEMVVAFIRYYSYTRPFQSTTLHISIAPNLKNGFKK